MKKRGFLLLLVLALLALSGCRKEESEPVAPPVETPPVAQEEVPPAQLDTLRVELSRGGLTTQQLADAVKTLPELLQTYLNEAGMEIKNVKATVGASSAATAETLAAGNVDLAFLPVEEFLLYGGGAQVLLADGYPAEDGMVTAGVRSLICAAPTEYGGQLAGRAESGLTWNELSRAKWGVLEKGSLAGYRGFDLWLADNYEGQRATDLPQVTVYDSYEKLLRAAAAEEVDAVVIRDDVRAEFATAWTQDADRTDEAGLRGFGRAEDITEELPVLAETERLYTTVAAQSVQLDAAALESALERLSREEPELMLALGAARFAPVEDEQLDAMRRLVTIED